MKRIRQYEKAFGKTEEGLVAFPEKISNVQTSRVIYGDHMGCSRCFPHGWETSNLQSAKTDAIGKITEKQNGDKSLSIVQAFLFYCSTNKSRVTFKILFCRVDIINCISL